MRVSAAVALGALAATSSAFNIPNALTPVLKQAGLGSTAIKSVVKTDGAIYGPVSTFWSDWLKWVTLVVELTTAPAPQSAKFEGWSTFKANGVNLGAWLEIEESYTDILPAAYADEWTWCEAVGQDVCGPVLEEHYSTYVTEADIDEIALYGVNTIRIPTTYAAWAAIDGSELYHGNQVAKMSKIAEYAINKYSMHVVLGLHSLPGGVNILPIGEASGHMAWWNNATYFNQSLIVVNKVLDFIQASPNTDAYTFSPINEPGDNVAGLFTTTMVSYPTGVNYLMAYFRAVQALMLERQMSNTLMVSDTYAGPRYWAPYWASGSNIVFDSHIYHFAETGVTGADIPQLACAQAQNYTTTFPVFVGEFSASAELNNTLSLRPQIYQTQLYAFTKYICMPTFLLTRISHRQTDYEFWSFKNLINAGAVNLGGALTHVYKGC
ncbi:hypothetical protein RQP46_000944 [Phenoliferia psychrophenolica]